MKEHAYKNGNVFIGVKEDGSKIYYTPDGEEPNPIYPETINLKITNKCDIECGYCCEGSTCSGKHGHLGHLFLNYLPPYTLVNIIGGAPMSHPDLYDFLVQMKKQGVICTLTVHWMSFTLHANDLLSWSKQELIHKLYVSVNQVVYCDVFNAFARFPNICVSAIAGVADVGVFRQMANRNLDLLIRGYKCSGKGEAYKEKAESDFQENMSWLKSNINELVKWNKSVSVDSRAAAQLELTSGGWVPAEDLWPIYIDLSTERYALNAESKRHRILSHDIRKLYATARKG